MPFPSPGGLPEAGIEPGSPVLQAQILSHLGSPGKTVGKINRIYTFRYIKRKREDSSKIRNERGNITTDQRKTKLREVVNNYVNANDPWNAPSITH